jgi:Cu-Zn family superoxide dismutase
MMKARPLIALAACATAACTMNGGQRAGAADRAPASASADVRDSGGRQVATASASQLSDGIRIRLEVTGLAPGTYGAHIHTIGRCDAPDFTTAGPHWNPTGSEHGKNNPRGMHKGDLPNLLVGADGRGAMEITVASAWVAQGSSPMLDADGASVVIHEKPDDYQTDPSGNSGARKACGVFS